MNYVIIPFSGTEMIIGFAILVALLVIILIAVLRRPGAKAPAADDAPVAFQSAPAYPAFAGVDGAMVAAIAAAVSMMGQAEGKRLVVRAVRRSDNWADAGRRESQY